MEGADTDAVRLGNRQLGTVDCVAQSLAVGPVFSAVLLGALLFGLSGGDGPWAVVITFVGMLGIGWTVSEFAKRYAGSGTVYEFIAHSLGKRVAVFAAGAYYFAVFALSAVAIPIVGGILLKHFAAAHWGFDWPWWLWSFVVIAIIFLINTLGVQVSVKTQLVVIVMSIIPLIILAIAVFADGGPKADAAFDPNNVFPNGGIFKGLLFGILLYVGFELSAALGEETANPKHSIPRAVLATLGIVTVIYLVSQIMLNVGASNDTGPAFEGMAQVYVGTWLRIWVEIALILDVLAVGIGFCLAGARGLFTLSRDGLIPKWFGTTSAREQPQGGNIAVAVVGVICILISLAKYGTDQVSDGVPFPDVAFNAFLICSTIGGFIICIIYALLCIGALKGQARRPVDLLAAVVGLGIAALGVAAQFIDGTAPVGDAKWGIWFSLIALGLLAVWTVTARQRAVDNVGRHTVHHGHEVPHPL